MSLQTPSSRIRLQPVWLISLTLALVVLGWELGGLDLAVMRLLGTPGGFSLRHHWLLEKLLHNDVRLISNALFIGLWLAVWWPVGGLRQTTRAQRVWLMVTITLCLVAINVMKRLATTSCPWELTAFGGAVPYVSHWNLRLFDGGSGHCFPAGHASAAFGFVAGALLWLGPANNKAARTGWLWLSVVGLCGLGLGLVQTLRGAHYPSHTLWTAAICWGISVVSWFAYQLYQPSPTWRGR